MDRGEARGALLALAIGLSASNCASGMRYAPATPLSATRDAAALHGGKQQALLTAFVRQQTETSCSLATTTTILNAIRQSRRLAPLSQATVLQTDLTGGWARDTHDAQSRGVTLDRLALLMMQAFGRGGVKRVAVDIVHVREPDLSEAAGGLWRSLEAFATADSTSFIVLNFLQSIYLTDGAAVGHMSLVGAWDRERAQVLVLDVDSHILQPYWVPLPVLLRGMNTADDETGEPRGFLVLRLDG